MCVVKLFLDLVFEVRTTQAKKKSASSVPLLTGWKSLDGDDLDLFKIITRGENSFNVNLQTADRGSVSFLYPCRIKLCF